MIDKKNRLSSVPLKNIRIDDTFWNPSIDLVRNVILPYQWEILNDKVVDAVPSHCLKNFKIAAGLEEGEFEGAVFQDTDIAKWLEAAAYSLETHPDEELENLVDETIELIGRVQGEDGYLNTYFTIKEPNLRWSNLQEGHELYTAGHFIEAGTAHYQATGKTNLLNIVSKLADCICKEFGKEEGKSSGYPGHQEIELALIRLYEVTGKRDYLETAKYFIDIRGEGENYFLAEEKQKQFKRIFPEFSGYDPKYSQSHLPVREQKTVEGHAVRAVYMLCAMADLANEYQDQSLLNACITLWDNMVHKRMFVTGSIGSSGILERFTTDYDLPNDSNYSETCASIGLALFGKRMAQITKDASYMDVVETALYNTVLSGIAMDGKSFFYVNPLEVWPDNCLERTSKEHVKAVRQKWFGVACCPPNIARTLASLGQYIYFTDEDTIYTNLYLSNQTEIKIKNTEIKLSQDSDYLKSGKVTIKVENPTTARINLAFRIPGYADKGQTILNGEPVSSKAIIDGYLLLKGDCREQTICLQFPMKARIVHANPLVRANAGKAAILKGPLVYCLEEVDNGKNLAAVFLDTKAEPEEIFEQELLGGVTKLKIKGKKIKQDSWPEEERGLYTERKTCLEDITMTAVPYCRWGNRGPGEMTVWIKELLI